MSESTTTESNVKGTNPSAVLSRTALYNKLAAHAPEAIEALVELMKTSTNHAVRVSAANTILNKCVPDIKGLEIKGENGEPIKLQLIAGNGYIPQLVALNAASETSTLREGTEVQSTDMAQASTQDNNGSDGVGKAITD